MKRGFAFCAAAAVVTLLASVASSDPADPLAAVFARASLPAAAPLACVSCQSSGVHTPPFTATGATCVAAENTVAADTKAYADTWCATNRGSGFHSCNVNTFYGTCTASGSGHQITGAAAFSCTSC